MNEQPGKLMKPSDAAQRLGCSVRLVYTLASTGRLPSIRISTRTIRFRASDVDEYIDRCATSPAPGRDSKASTAVYVHDYASEMLNTPARWPVPRVERLRRATAKRVRRTG